MRPVGGQVIIRYFERKKNYFFSRLDIKQISYNPRRESKRLAVSASTRAPLQFTERRKSLPWYNQPPIGATATPKMFQP